MKRIMVFIGGYLPGEKYGGPVTSISNFTDLLGDDYDIRIVCCNHDFKDLTPYSNINEGWNTVGKAKVFYLSDEEQNYKTYVAIMKETVPDLIYGSGIMYIKVNAQIFKAAKEQNIPILLAPRGDICSNALQIKKWKKIPFLKFMRLTKMFDGMFFHATMQEEVDNLEKYLGIDKRYTFLLPNLPTSPIHRDNYVKEKGRVKVLFISRIQEKKNLLNAIRIVNSLSVPVEFDIYGPLENPEYWKKCQEEIEKAPTNAKIRYKGALAPKDAKIIFSKYDCFLFPTYSENYGHVIVESLMHDCPIVISKGTTQWDDVVEYGAGAAVDLNDLKGFTKELEKIALMDNIEYHNLTNKLKKYVAYKINIDTLKESYKIMMEEAMRGFA